MKYLLILFMVLTFSACSLLKQLPSPEKMQDDIKRFEVHLNLAPELNRRLRRAGVFDKKQYESNKIDISKAGETLTTVKILIDMDKLERADTDLEWVREVIDSLK